MKGVIVNCIEEVLEKKYNKQKLEKIKEKAGVKSGTIFLAGQNVEDKIVMELIQAACSELSLSLQDFGILFGDYWVNHFSQRIYSQYYNSHKTAKDFLLQMNDLHKTITNNMPGATPPQFQYEHISEKKIGITYKSHRNLIDLFIGLIYGVGNYYKEKLKVEKLTDSYVTVEFL